MLDKKLNRYIVAPTIASVLYANGTSNHRATDTPKPMVMNIFSGKFVLLIWPMPTD